MEAAEQLCSPTKGLFGKKSAKTKLLILLAKAPKTKLLILLAKFI